jgi:hypothetical protein
VFQGAEGLGLGDVAKGAAGERSGSAGGLGSVGTVPDPERRRFSAELKLWAAQGGGVQQAG